MKTNPVRYNLYSSFELCLGRGFRVRSFMSELSKSFHDRTSLIDVFHFQKKQSADKETR